MISSTHFKYITTKLTGLFVKKAEVIAPKMWQAIESPQPMRELLNISFTYSIPTGSFMVDEIKPNKEWADLHFCERTSGIPMNPGFSYELWPFYKMDKDMRREGELFSHTYMERFWPKFANSIQLWDDSETFHEFSSRRDVYASRLRGVRYHYGDLEDVIKQLLNDPHTRQAYLPIFFPEDTGNQMQQRVPCTLGYHLIMRNNKLHIVYYMRSCDYIRHFRDDVYLACKLVHWVLDELKKMNNFWSTVQPGNLTMHITSLHVFESDMYRLNKEHEKNNEG
jgi:thymidylate synthase